MADSPSPPPEDQDAQGVQRIIKEGAEQTTVEDLRKRGYTSVRVIKEDKIRSLITESIENILAKRSQEYVAEERRRLSQDAMNEFQDMMADHQESLKLQEELLGAQASLEEEYETIAAGISERVGAQGQGELAQLKEQFSALLALVQQKDAALVERTRELKRQKRKLSKALEDISELNRENQRLRSEQGELAESKNMAEGQAEEEIRRLRQEKRRMETAIEDARELAERTGARNLELERDINGMRARLEELSGASRDEVEALHTEVKRLSEFAEKLRAENAAAQRESRDRLSEEIGKVRGLEGENAELLEKVRTQGRQARVAQEALDQEQRETQELRADNVHLREKEKEILGHLQELEGNLDHYKSELVEMHRMVDGFVGALSKRMGRVPGLEKLREGMNRELEELDEDQDEARELREEIKDELSTPPPAPTGGDAPPPPDGGLAVSMNDFEVLDNDEDED